MEELRADLQRRLSEEAKKAIARSQKLIERCRDIKRIAKDKRIPNELSRR